MKLKKLLVLLLLLGSAFILTACAEQGLPGETGAQGDKGQTGDKGPTGAQGAAGADGVQIEFSFTSEGLAWRYVGTEEWTVGISFADIYTVINEYEVGPIIKAHGFDYVVDSSYAHLTAGAEQSVFGEALVFGETLFADLQSAFDAAKAASEVEGYEGLQIFVNKGQYEAATLEAPKVEIFGPNVNADPNDTNVVRVGEATIIESLIIAADDVVINGLAFDLAGQVKASDKGGIDNVTVKYCHFLETSTYNASVWGRIEYMWEREVDTSVNTMTFTNPTECTDYSNLVVENCRFESTGARTQNIYGMQLNGLTIKNNVFLGANNGTYDDCVKFTELVTYSIKGDVIVQNNIFANFGQYILWFLDIGPSNFQVTHNKFEHVGLCDGGTASLYRAPLTASFPIADLFGEEDKLVINFSKNEVVDANVGFRSDYKDLPAEKVEIKVNYNIFESIVNADRLIYNNNLDEITEENYAAIDASNNYYDITVSADNFNGVTAWEPVLTNREDALK